MSWDLSWDSIWHSAYWVWLGTEAFVLLKTRTRRGNGKLRDRGSLIALWVTIAASITVGTWIGEANRHTASNGPEWMRSAAVVVLIAGLVLRWAAILALGRSFSANVAIHATQTVYRGGVFRYIRHPSYTGLMLVFLALGLHTRNWIGLAVVLLPTTAVLLYRIRVEEAALSEAFGEEYREYSRTTKRLIPGVY